MPKNGNQWTPYRAIPRTSNEDPFAGLGDDPGAEGAFDFQHVSAENLRDAVASWVSRGYAITFGLTSDGGAIGVHLLAGGKKKSEYFGNVAKLEDFLTRITAQHGPE